MRTVSLLIAYLRITVSLQIAYNFVRQVNFPSIHFWHKADIQKNTNLMKLYAICKSPVTRK